MKTNISGWICVSVDSIADERPWFAFFGHKPDGESYVPLCEHTIAVDVSGYDPRQQAVAAIDAAITQARADFQKRITELQAQKQSLLALTMDTVEAS